MSTKDINQRCAIVIITDGFEEAETISMLSLLRQASVCVKCVGLTSGLVRGAHGVCIMPDATLSDLDPLDSTASISAVILPEGRQSLTRLEADPRVHQLLRQVVARRGQIITSREGLRVTRAAAVWSSEPQDVQDDPTTAIVLREPGQSPEAFVQDLVRRLRQPPQAHQTAIE